jgi:hypothetical protein
MKEAIENCKMKKYGRVAVIAVVALPNNLQFANCNLQFAIASS